MREKIAGVCLAGALLLTMLGGCASTTKNPENTTAEQAYTFTDDLGREVTVNHPQRVAALLGSYADLWVLAGGELCAATDDAWKDFDLPLDEDTVNLGVLKQLSLEALLSSRPDFVLASICLGVIPLTVEELIRALAQGPGAGWESSIVWYARLPRTLASVFAGAALASSGAVLQNVLANKLASPNVIGVNAGAGLGVTVCAAARGEPQRSCSKASAVKMW